MLISLLFTALCATSLQESPGVQFEAEYVEQSADHRHVLNVYFRNACSRPIALGELMTRFRSEENHLGHLRTTVSYFFDSDIVNASDGGEPNDPEIREIEGHREFVLWVKPTLEAFECWKAKIEIPFSEKPASQINLVYSPSRAVIDSIIFPGPEGIDVWKPMHRVLLMNDVTVNIKRKKTQ